ncbi:MAG: sarcosine oxidase subunit gamma [Gemmobacter sp.]|nr:sarcosine oxidase subunit gamma [Gemmobacter sp.]
MAEHRLKPLTPLGHDRPETVSIGPVTLTEVVDQALASLAARQGREEEVAQKAKAAGIPLPAAARAEPGTPYGAFWLSEQSWMVEAPYASHEDIRAILLPLFGDAASITEQTDAWVRFDVSGSDLSAMFERLCNVDLRAAPDNLATRTVIEHMGCYLVRRARDRLSVFGARSSAAALWHALETAAHSAY